MKEHGQQPGVGSLLVQLALAYVGKLFAKGPTSWEPRGSLSCRVQQDAEPSGVDGGTNVRLASQGLQVAR